MAPHQYRTLLAALQEVPDPRKARGKRYAWALMLTLLVAGLASNQQTARAIAQWVQHHLDELRAALPGLRHPPSESTFLRVLRRIDATQIEQHVARFVGALPDLHPQTVGIISPQGEILRGQALDGKTIRTATAHGTRTHMVSLVEHGSARTLGQMACADKQSEAAASRHLLADRDLTGSVTTMDAGLTQRPLAQQIRDQNGHYLMVVKKNHPQMYAELAAFFATPGIIADHERFDRCRMIDKGHGRLETRTLECLSGHCPDWHWPDSAQVIQRTCERRVHRSGTYSREVSYGVTSLSADDATAADLERLWRGHWTIENRKHYVRDVTLGEDRQPMHRGQAPQVLATLRNALIDVWRAEGWTNIADAVRATAASVRRALRLIGALPEPTMT